MKAYGIAVAMVGCLFAVSAPADGQTLPLTHIATKVRIGDRMQVIDVNRKKIEGRFRAVSATGLTLLVKGATVDVPESQIVQVRRQRHEPDGVLLGLGIGALAGFTFVGVSCRDAGEPDDCRRVGSLVIAAPVAAAGALIDMGLRHFDTVYERGPTSTVRWRAAPVLHPRFTGVVIGVTF